MAIQSYQENGETLFKVYVHQASPFNKGCRAQMRKSGLKNIESARREEKKMLLECKRRLTVKEVQDELWKNVINAWEEDVSLSKVAQGHYAQSTIIDYGAMLRNYTKEWLNRPASSITRGDGRKVLEEVLQEGKTKTFTRKLKFVINHVFNWGIENRVIRNALVSPVTGIKIDCKVEKVPEILTLTEIRTLLFEAKSRKHPWYSTWAMALLTGMRAGELYSLEWNDIDFENNIIRVSKSYDKRTDTFKSTKAGYWRSVPISTELNDVLVQLKAETGNTQWVLPRHNAWKGWWQSKVLKTFLKEIGLPLVKFHTLRACFATQLLGDGVEMAKVMKIGGWCDVKTMQIYMRLAGIDEKGATENLRFLPSDEAVMGRVVQLFKV